MINKINSIHQVRNAQNLNCHQRYSFDLFMAQLPDDLFVLQNKFINKNLMVEKGLIEKDENINTFFDDISNQILKNQKEAKELSSYLKAGVVALSSSIYRDMKNPSSATSLKIDFKKQGDEKYAQIKECIKNNKGVGINFNKADNPVLEILKINSLAKKINSNRPPALIGLLSVYNSNVIDFITLKNNADFNKWCFDLSVILPDDFLSKVDKNEQILLNNGKLISAREIYDTLLNSMLKNGEPGVIFSSDEDYNCDCCACSKLEENEQLILGHINLSNIFDENSKQVDYNLLKKATLALAKAMREVDLNSRIGICGYQDLLDKLNLNYGEKKANDVLEKCLIIIQKEAHDLGLKTAISPTGTTSRILKTTPSIEPRNNQVLSYYNEINTLSIAQKYIDENISKTIILKKDYDVSDIDNIIRYSKQKGIKGITVFPLL